MWHLFLIVMVGGGLFLLFASGAERQHEGEIAKTNQTLAKVPNFRPAITDSTGWNKPSISIDPTSEQFAITTPNQPAKVYRFDQLVAAEVVRDGNSITKTNRGGQVAGAAVGAALLGPAGLLLGGLTGSKRQEEKIKRLALRIYTNDLITPFVEVPFLDVWGGINANSIVVKGAARRADEWYGRFQAILSRRTMPSVGFQNQVNSADRNDGPAGIADAISINKTTIDEAVARQRSEERIKAIQARIEYKRLRRASQVEFEPRH